MRLVIVSGLSGAGKTVALNEFEDLGYYCIDNLPLTLIRPLSLKALRDPRYQRLAVGVDARESPRAIAQFPTYVERLRGRGIETQVLFLTAHDDVILRRYSETRRKHPLTGAGLSLGEAIEKERRLVKPIADLADVTLDTSQLNLHQLRDEIRQRLPEAGTGKLAVILQSFGFKNGLPDDADFIFDVRCLPNPHWNTDLRSLDGRDAAVAEFLGKLPEVARMTDSLRVFLNDWLPSFRAQDRAYVTVAVGCTGGRHRSVYIVERLAESLRGRFDPVIVKHKELS